MAAGNAHLAIADSENFRVLIYNAPFTTDESASVVLGQPDFSQRNSSPIPTANTLGFPVGVAVDGSGNLWVADGAYGRVVEFQPPFTDDMDASLVIGQTALNPTQPIYASFQNPVAVAFDSHGDLWVDDLWASEISEFTPPFTNGMGATLTIGQVSPCDISYHYYVPSSASATTLCGPTGIAFDAHGDLWVSDFYDLHVLEFAPPFSSGMAASLELGQPAATAFTSNSLEPTSANSICGPGGLSFDASGNLWVVDSQCNRVLKFAPPFSNDMAASLVLGQPDFTEGYKQGVITGSADILAGPANLWFNGNGNLMVSDSGDGRVLIFTPPFSSGMNATTVMGRPSVTNVGDACLDGQPENAVTPNTLCVPDGGVTF
jgi:sugar lactone lactonase YvrE